jgi:hypothetical protein
VKAVSPPIDTMEQKALALPDRAQHIEISDQVTYDVAVRFLGDVTALETAIVEHHKPIKDAAHKAHREACLAEKRLLDPVQQAKLIVRKSIAIWNDEQERIRREEERQAIEAAAKEEEKLRQEMAKQAEELGASKETVEEILITPIPIPRPVIAATFRPAAGISNRVTYRAEVTDIRALCRAVADGKVSPLLVEANQSALNKLASAEKQTLNIPGVRVIRDTGITTRRR